MQTEDFRAWLDDYGRAWEARNAAAASLLFAESAHYYWTPFEAAKIGRTQIAEAWKSATSHQEDILFEYQIITFSHNRGFATWYCRYKRPTSGREVRLDGVLAARFDPNGLCTEFREWWHSNESS